MNTDKELLELAAKAAGLPVEFEEGNTNGWWPCGRDEYGDVASYWNPLTDDGDALRLAVKCNLWIGQHDDGVTVSDAYGRFKGALEEDYGGDPYAATRRSIVRAAAAIGETL